MSTRPPSPQRPAPTPSSVKDWLRFGLPTLLVWLALWWSTGVQALVLPTDAGTKATEIDRGASATTTIDQATRQDSSLVIRGEATSFNLWPAVRVLKDPDGRLTWSSALSKTRDFESPRVPEANFGVEPSVVWLHVPLRATAEGQGTWVLNLGYAPLTHVDVHWVRDGRLVRHAHLGSAQAFTSRPLPTRTPSVALTLEAGEQQDLLLRVATTSSMVLPLSLQRPTTLLMQETREQLLLGLAFGVTLAMLAYCVSQWLALRNVTFVYYALMLTSTSVFLLSYTGVGQQHLWSGLSSDWVAKLAPQAVLFSTASGAMFGVTAMNARVIAPRIDQWLRAIAMLAVMAMLLTLAGWLDYRQAQLAATVLGPLVIFLSVPVCWKRAQAGEAMGVYMLLGWLCYFAGALTLALLLRGLVPANGWTIHIFQFCSGIEMLFWMRVLSLHGEAARLQAESASAEHRALEALAHTDALTGVSNRRGLNRALDEALDACCLSAQAQEAAVFMLDLDDFKPINDTHGHEVGDALLIEVAKRLKQTVRTTDLVARLGGDEFVVLAQALGAPDDAAALGQKLLRTFNEPFVCLGVSCRVGVSIGYARAPAHGTRARNVLRCADLAMYASKQIGGNSMHGYDVRMGVPDDAESDVDRALATRSPTAPKRVLMVTTLSGS